MRDEATLEVRLTACGPQAREAQKAQAAHYSLAEEKERAKETPDAAALMEAHALAMARKDEAHAAECAALRDDVAAARAAAAAAPAREEATSEATSEETTEALKQSCLLYTSPSPRDQRGSRMPSSA